MVDVTVSWIGRFSDRRKILFCLLWISGFSFVVPEAFAVQLSVDVPGVSYYVKGPRVKPIHIGVPYKSKHPSSWVWNRGIGFGFDTRRKGNRQGFSFMNKNLFVMGPIDNRIFFSLGLGGRYRYPFLEKRLSVDVDLMLSYMMGASVYLEELSKYAVFAFFLPPFSWGHTVMPSLSLGLNYHFQWGGALGTNFTFAPKRNNGFWMPFIMFNFSFPLCFWRKKKDE